MENFILINTSSMVTGGWVTIVIALLVGGIALGIVACILGHWEKCEIGALVLFPIAILMMFASLLTFVWCPKTIEHKVALKEGVTIEQVAEDYEIVDGNGIIFTIREKGE